jgi:hypothetical protein
VLLGRNTISVSVVAVLLAFLLTLLTTAFVQVSRPLRVSLPLLLIASTVLVLSGRQLSRFSVEHPQRNSIIYSVNVDERQAAWISNDDAADEWTAQFLGSDSRRREAGKFTLGSGRSVLLAEAELLPLDPPEATVISDDKTGDQRVLKLHLTSPRRANTLLMRIASNAAITSVTVNGRAHEIEKADAKDSSWFFRYNAPPAEGVDLELRLASTAPMDCWIGDRSLGLPEIPGKNYRARPPEMMPRYGSDLILVGRQYTF